MNSVVMDDFGRNNDFGRNEPGMNEFGRDTFDASTVRLDDLHWQTTYDRASIERFVAEVDAERARLQSEIDQARSRLGRAQQAQASRRSDLASQLGDLVMDAHRRLVEMERNHQQLIDTIRATAEEEAARILDAARAAAARLGTAAEQLGADR